jgi:spoIIIJ-associated protein
VGEVLSLQEQGESAREFIEGLIEELGLEATVGLREVDSETIEVVVDGQELGILVGRGGATLSALQELARTVVQSRTAGPTERILVDVAGYRAKRAEALQRFTRQVAEEVVASGAEQAMEPMLAPDRKVVHDTVSDIEGVETRSEGEEPRRYVVLSPQGTPAGSSSDSDG